MTNPKWTSNNIPSQKGKVVIVTGSTSGLGKEAASVLAGKGARVILAVRNTQKAEGVAQEIQQAFPQASLDIRRLDLNSLSSVQEFAEGVKASYDRLDILINNARRLVYHFSP
jgi:NAD(P)-dependent dehydrogenase (short-subunit alcohol dehydrogenase family)